VLSIGVQAIGVQVQVHAAMSENLLNNICFFSLFFVLISLLILAKRMRVMLLSCIFAHGPFTFNKYEVSF